MHLCQHSRRRTESTTHSDVVHSFYQGRRHRCRFNTATVIEAIPIWNLNGLKAVGKQEPTPARII